MEARSGVRSRGWSRLGRDLLILLAALLVAAPAAATTQWGTILSPTPAQVLRSGDLVEVRWSLLPAGVDEFELLLSVADGARLELRLTPQLEPELHRFLWRVPDLPAASARLRLRVGFDGEEVEGPWSAPFTILLDPGVRPRLPHFRRGEWWAEPCRWPLARCPEPSRQRAAGTSLARGKTHALIRASDELAVEPPGQPDRPERLQAVPQARSWWPPLSHQPLSYPLLR